MMILPRYCRRLRSSICGRAVAAEGKSRFWSDEGGNLVEFAFASMIFFAFFIGIFDFALAFYTFHYVSNAARQGSRYAMVRGGECSKYDKTTPCPAQNTDISSYVEGLGYPGIDTKNMSVAVQTCAPSTIAAPNNTSTTVWTTCAQDLTYNLPGDQVQVTVTYNFPLGIPFWKSETVSIGSSSNMVYAQ